MAFTSKNLVRFGALLVMVGFFMPTMLVSCSGFGTTSSMGELSLATLAGGNTFQAGESSLYLVFFGMLIAMAATFFYYLRPDMERYMPMVEAGAVGISLLVMLSKLLQLKSQVDSLGLKFELRYGAFFLFAGFLLALGGVIMAFTNGSPLGFPISHPSESYGKAFPIPPTPPGSDFYQPPPPPVYNQASSSARLELVSGNSPLPFVQLTGTDFTIGRGSANDLRLPDKSVSRSHVRLRYAQGSWFIQDQESAIGTYVNGQRVQAGRLNPGDQLKIGSTIFTFRS